MLLHNSNTACCLQPWSSQAHLINMHQKYLCDECWVACENIWLVLKQWPATTVRFYFCTTFLESCETYCLVDMDKDSSLCVLTCVCPWACSTGACINLSVPLFPVLSTWQEGGELAEGDGQEADQQTHKEEAYDQQEEQDEYWRWWSPLPLFPPMFLICENC